MKLLSRLSVLTILVMLVGVSPALATPTIPLTDISRIFGKISASPTLSNPSMILIDRATGEIVFQKDATSLRKPASILKLLSTTAALEYLDPNYQYVTRMSLGKSPETIVISGNLDPWMTGSYVDAKKYRRAFLPYLVNRAIAKLKSDQQSPLTRISVEQRGLYSGDIAVLRNYFRAKGVTAKFTSLSAGQVLTNSGEEITTITSPTISNMVKFALTWSDNLLAERLARAASHSVGFSMDDAGVAETIKKLLGDLKIDQSGLYIHDGSGLSKQDRVTAKLIADLLLKIRGDERFASIFEGLPISGISGTLESRYVNTAPQAVGLIHAKTGTLDGTVSLAGYVESGSREYVFVAIADHILKGQAATDRARTTLDRLLGKITAPLTRTAALSQPTGN